MRRRSRSPRSSTYAVAESSPRASTTGDRGARRNAKERDMAKGIEKSKKTNKPKLSTKEKQKKKKEKKAAK
jgi:hypothetical protein